MAVAGDVFITCLQENLEALKGYGAKRTKAALDQYIAIRDSRIANGDDALTAQYEAMQHVTNQINEDIEVKQAALRKNVSVMADANQRFEHAFTPGNVKTARGLHAKAGMAMRSLNEVSQSVPGASVFGEEERIHSLYQAILTRASETITNRRRFGRAPPRQAQADLNKEMFGEASGNPDAKAAADALHQIFAMHYATIRGFGVKVRPYVRMRGLPVGLSSNKLLQGGEAIKTFVPDMLAHIDWATQQWPDGRPVLASEREDFIEAVHFGTTTTGKKTSFEDKWSEDLNKAFLRDLQDQRLLQFKNSASWQFMHDRYADGNVFQTVQSTITHLSREEAKAKVYGPDPDRMVATVAALAQSKVLDLHVAGDPRTAKAINAPLNAEIRTYHDESALALRTNAMNPNWPALTAGATANLVSAAQLGSAIIMNVAMDGVQVSTMMMAENRGVQNMVRLLAHYIKNQMPGRAYTELLDAQKFGFAHDDLVFNDLQTTRLSIATTVAPTYTKAWARFWTMAGGVPRHTSQLRNAVNRGFLADMARWRNSAYADLPTHFQRMLEHNQVSAADWEKARASMAVLRPRQGVELFDSIQSYTTMPLALAEKLHRMQVNEVNGKVLMPTNEANAKLKLGTRPDSVAGVIVASSSMYLAQPLAAAFTTARTLMHARMSPGRTVATVAGLATGMLVTGALGIQVRNAIAGREFEAMDTGDFWFRAAIGGGMFNVLGSFVSAIYEEDYGQVAKTVAGPLIGAAGETLIAATKTGSQMLGLSDDTDGLRALATAIERYISPKPFYAGAVINRELWERAKEIADPVGYRRSRSTQMNNMKRRGQAFRPGWKSTDRPISDLLMR